MKEIMRLISSPTLLLLLLTLYPGTVFANPLPSVMGEYNGIFFRNSEVLIDRDGNGEISVGDTLWGVLKANEIVAPTDVNGQTGPTLWDGGEPTEITGYFATDVAAILAPGAGASATRPTIVLDTASVDPNGILGPGEVMRIFEDSASNFADYNQGKALETATDGTLLWSLGLDPGGGSVGGYWYSIASPLVPASGDVGESYGGLNVIIAPPGDAFGLVNDPAESFSSGAGVLYGLDVQFWFNSEIFRLPANVNLEVGPDKTMHFGSNDPAVYKPAEEEVPGQCRMTGGQNRVIPAIGIDGLDTWGYEFEQLDGDGFVTTGGQIGAPSGSIARGHWVHQHHNLFEFKSGTSSAPNPETYIDVIECADPGWCVQARCAPFKQIFWSGIGEFGWKEYNASLPCVIADKRDPNYPSFHYYEAMVGDFGENDRPTREDALADENPETCDWFSKLPGGVPPGPYDASEAVFLDSALDDQFRDKGGQVCDKCPDYYQIRIHCTTDPNSPIIYEFEGFVSGGNYQIHPKTGEQCPATDEALVPEFFESTKKVPPGQNK